MIAVYRKNLLVYSQATLLEHVIFMFDRIQYKRDSGRSKGHIGRSVERHKTALADRLQSIPGQKHHFNNHVFFAYVSSLRDIWKTDIGIQLYWRVS